MKHQSLASKYRPQTFKDVVGQHAATAALSRASAEKKVAAAYLLSGTRGVGKTTIARIFAKALNCEHPQGAEPCNACPQCLQITAGNHVDVCEIDGASNTGVDDVRGLRENIGYRPMEGRYKIFIIDEAHMLSKSAFNALLKTLEEPPERTVFIFATTEAHRFPATIISRCQHFVFKHLPEDLIVQHLGEILQKENIEYEAEALRLIGRRAAGSMRDGLSLLDQVLALSTGKLVNATVRESLGLAGQELFGQLFTAISGRQCDGILTICRQLLSSGVDIGFFIRELAGYLRNLFLYCQAGAAILPSLNIAPDEAAFIKRYGKTFTPAHLHAAWQMTLENQRGIAQSPEPGAALELLLLNLALLPQLLPVGSAQMPPAIDKENTPPQNKSEEPAKPEQINSSQEWENFYNFCQEMHDFDVPPSFVFDDMEPRWGAESLTVIVNSDSVKRWLTRKPGVFEKAVFHYLGRPIEIKYINYKPVKTKQELIEEFSKKPEVIMANKILGAELKDCIEKDKEKKD